MQSKLTWKTLFIVAIVAFALLRVWPPEQKLQGGLDLVGGYSLTYKVDLAGDKECKLYISGLRQLLPGIPNTTSFSEQDWSRIRALHGDLRDALGEAKPKERKEALKAKATALAESITLTGKQIGQLEALYKATGQPSDTYGAKLRELALDGKDDALKKIFEMPQGDAKKVEVTKFVAAQVTPVSKRIEADLEEVSRDYREWQRLRRRREDFGNPRDVLTQLISILRNRVDPDGTRNTVWKPLPPDRIEVSMSRAPDAVSDRFDEYEQAVDAVESLNVDDEKLDVLLEKGPIARAPELKAFLAEYPNLSEQIETVIRLYDQWQGVLAKVAELQSVSKELAGKISDRNDARPAETPALSIKEVEEFAKLEAAAEKDARRKAFLAKFRPELRDGAARALASYETLLADPLARASRRGPAKTAYYDARGKLNLTRAAVHDALQMDAENMSEQRDEQGRRMTYRQVAIRDLKARFPRLKELKVKDVIAELRKQGNGTVDGLALDAWGRMTLIDYLVFTWERYEKIKGPLSDPSDLQRLLKGAGKLQFAMTVAIGDAELSTSDENTLREILKRRGLEAANDYNPKFKWYKVRKPDNPGVDPFKFAADGKVFYIRENLGGVARRYKQSGHIMMHGKRVLDYEGGVDYILCYNDLSRTLDDRKQRTWKLTRAGSTTDERGLPAISFQFDGVGASYFGELTGTHKGQQMAVILDGEIYSAPTIQSRITNRGIITGRFSRQEQDRMIRTLISGMLPGRLIEKPVSERLISASIGTDNVKRSLTAGLIALAIVTIFMILYYMITGVIADIALLMNVLFVLAAMVSFGATFTLAGVAGVILTIGMAVDANILINERIREELAGSRTSLRLAIRNAYDRVMRTIVDANLTTLLTALVLLWVGNDEVKGFGITLTLGLLLNMFTALFVTRIVLQMVTAEKGELRRMFDLSAAELGPPLVMVALVGLILWGFDVHGIWGMLVFFALIAAQLACGAILIWVLRFLRRGFAVRFKSPLPMLRIVRNAKVDWVKKKTVFWIISSVLVLFSLFAFFMRGVLSNEIYGIEFRPGVLIQMELQKPMSVTAARQRVRAVAEKLKDDRPELAASFAGASVVGVGNPTEPGGALYGDYQVQVSTEQRKFADAGGPDDLPNPWGGETSQQVADVKKELINAFALSPEADGDDYAALKGELKDETWLKMLKPVAVTPTDLDFRPVDLEVAMPADWRVREGMKNVRYRRYEGGVRLFFDKLTPALTKDELRKRIDQFTRKEDVLADFPDLFHNLDFKVFAHGTAEADAPLSRFEVVARWTGGQLQGERRISFLKGMNRAIVDALGRKEAFPLEQSVDPYIAGDSQRKAAIAIILSLLAIIVYIWIRFGRVTYGLAAVVALAHDVIIATGMVCLAGWIVLWTGAQVLWLRDFKIDLAMVAAMLTIVGYSLNDTIVVFDRVRENRGRLGEHSPEVINASINQNLGRTIMTSLTTFMVVLVMYIFGGEAIRGFCFAIIIGVIVGTYSSIAIAAPLLLGLRSLAEKFGKQRSGGRGKQAPSAKTLKRRSRRDEGPGDMEDIDGAEI